jgi:hypothetical protein
VAVSVVETQVGSAPNPGSVSVSFADAVAGDLIVFCYAAYGGSYDWVPSSSAWKQIPSAGDPNGFITDGPMGMLWHIVQSGETSWSPVASGGSNQGGIWTAQRIQGHSIANPILNFYIAGNNSDSYPYGHDGIMYPMTVPGSNGVAPGMVFVAGGLPGSSEQGMKSTNATWTTLTSTDGEANCCTVNSTAVTDDVTQIYGTWQAAEIVGNFIQFAVQSAPQAAPDTPYIVHYECAQNYWPLVSGDVAFETSFTPTPGNILLVIIESALGPSSPTSPWDFLTSDDSVYAAMMTVPGSPGTSFNLGAWAGFEANPAAVVHIYELASVTYVASASQSPISGPIYETPNVASSTGPTLNIFGVCAVLAGVPIWPGYGVPDGTPDGCYALSINEGGGSHYVGAVGHALGRAGGDGEFTLPSVVSSVDGITVVFSLGPVPCPTSPPATTLGTLYPDTVPEARLTVYNANGTVNKIEVRDDLIGGRIQYEDTPSGCGACTLSLGIPWEAMAAPGGLIANQYWLGRNIVEISAWDDVIQADITSGATKIYVGSRAAYDPAYGNVDTPQLILDDGVNVTYRIPVTGVGTDGGGDFVTVGAPGAYPGGPSSIPAYAAGTKIFRRRYTGIIMARGLWNSRQPQGQVTLTGLAQYLNEAVGTFTINIEEVGAAIYACVNEFTGRWPQLVINSANFPYTAQAYSGSNQQYTLADEITQILSCGITNGDTWVVRVGHDWTVRLLRVYSQSCLAYDYTVTLDQGVTSFEAQFVQGQDEDCSNFYNSIEVTGDTNPTTKQPYGAIVQDAESIGLFGQVDGVPISNTSCKSDSDCALYGQALLDDNAIPRNNYQVHVFTYNDKYPSAPPMGLPRGDVILGVHNIKIKDFEAGAPDINGLCISVTTTMDVKTCDTYQDAKFAQIEPGWNRAIASRAGKLALALRRNVIAPVSVDSYMVGPNADQYSYNGGSLVVKNQAFQAVFGYGTGIQTIAAISLTMQPSTTNFVWLNDDGSFTITYQGEGGNPQPDQPPNGTCMLHSIFQTSASGVIGDIFKAPRGVLVAGGGGPGGGGVASLNGLTGIVALTSTGNSIIIDPSGSSIDLEAALAGLTDVSITALSNGQVLAWNATAGKWENVTPSTGPGTSASCTETTQAVSTYHGSSAPVELLAANTARIGATIYNKSARSLYVGTSSSTSLSLFMEIIPPDGYWVLPVAYTGTLYGVWDLADSSGQANIAAFPS